MEDLKEPEKFKHDATDHIFTWEKILTDQQFHLHQSPTGLEEPEQTTLNTHHHVDEKHVALTWAGAAGFRLQACRSS